MTATLQPFTSPTLDVAHGFFSRLGGVSGGLYAELNGGTMTDDLPENVRQNRCLMANYFNVSEDHFLGLRQIHSSKVMIIGEETKLWPFYDAPEADGLVTDCPDLVMTVATADCAPVLFSSVDGKIVGAAHAGWRGAVEGVLEATIEAMRSLGAGDIKAVIGPCIGAASYEVSSDMRDQLITHYHGGGAFFTPLSRKGQFLFDLPGFCEIRMRESGVSQVTCLALDTLRDQSFYSYRRMTLAGEKATGRQISAIRARSF